MVIWKKFNGKAKEWDDHIAALAGNFYQTYGWGEVRRTAGWNPLRLLGWENDRVVLAASILVKRKVFLSVCWIPGGPAGEIIQMGNQFLISIQKELNTKFIYCRIGLLRASEGFEADFLVRGGWSRPRVSMSSGLTMLYSLAGDEDERLNHASGNWRHNLKRSGRYQLNIEHWKHPDIDEIVSLFREMEQLKSLPAQHTEPELKAILTNCSSQVIFYRCSDKNNRTLAFRAAGISGKAALDLLAAAGSQARKLYASHATLWAILNHCSRLGLAVYDLSGVDPVLNKGVFDFKHGTGATQISCLGEWEQASFPGLRQMINLMMSRKPK